jgi:hypothetical protein
MTTLAYNITELPDIVNGTTHWYSNFSVHPAIIVIIIIAIGGLILAICGVVATCSKKPEDKKPLLSS